MLFALLALLTLALAAPRLTRLSPGGIHRWMAVVPALLSAWFFLRIAEIAAGGVLIESYPWAQGLDVRLSFLLDGLSLLFALLITGVGTLILLYAGSYLKGHRQLGRFYLYLIGFMTAMLGLVLASNLITLFIFWELTSLCSYFLIGFDHRREEARKAALQALLVTGAGGLALLAGFLLLGHAGGSMELTQLLSEKEVVRSHGYYLPILLLILVGAFTKSAQFPFHFWLPSAMEAPAPVSAYLHSVTMVKAGVYLLARFFPLLGGTDQWLWIVTAAGAITMLLGGALAFIQTDMKRLLAYTTINALGTLVFLLGIGTPVAIQAAVIFFLVHSLYKGSLFLTAGIVDHETGSRDVTVLRGLARGMPLIGAAAALSTLSMAGLPPFFGFIGKEAVYGAVIEPSEAAIVLTAAALCANIVLVAASAVFLIRPFFGGRAEEVRPLHVHPDLAAGPAALALLTLLAGFFPALVDGPLLSQAAGAVLRMPTEIHLALWHGFDLRLFLSAVTVAAGLALYAWSVPLRRAAAASAPLARFGPSRWYDEGIRGLMWTARGQTRFLQHGYLTYYLMVLFVAAITLPALALLRADSLTLATWSNDVQFFELVIALVILAAAVVAIRSPSRLGAIVAMGVIGYGIALIFIEFGAPDLAMTQFIIETIMVILFILVIYRLPIYSELSSRATRLRDALIALGGGGLMTVLVLAALGTGSESRLIDFFAEETYPAARGRDIVNVILVDFRAMDTLGEIAVLGLAGAGVVALLRLRIGGSGRGGGP